MNLYLRLLTTWFRALFEKSISIQDGCEQWFRVWPNDIDAFLHMNNGRYLQIMDVARFRWLQLTGALSVIRKKGWKVALGGNMTRYRRSLGAFTKFRVSSRLLCWDDRWFFLEHVFHTPDGRQVAVGVSRAAFRDASGWVSTDEVMAHVEPGRNSGEMPAYIRNWLDIEEDMYLSAYSATETMNARIGAVIRKYVGAEVRQGARRPSASLRARTETNRAPAETAER
jgi:acyl-CoA thioesterase FadM